MRKETKQTAKKTKKLTLEGLAAIVEKGFESGRQDLENLAAMTARGFESGRQDLENLAAMTARCFEGLETGLVKKIEESETRVMEKLNDRCDRIEFILLRDQSNRLERLEDKMRRVETALEIEA